MSLSCVLEQGAVTVHNDGCPVWHCAVQLVAMLATAQWQQPNTERTAGRDLLRT